MKRRKLLIPLALLLSLWGCTSQSKPMEEAPDASNPPVIEQETEENKPDGDAQKEAPEPDYQGMLENMSLEEKAGQLFLVSFQGESLDEQTKSFLKANHFGNVILFSKNTGGKDKIAALTAEIQKEIQANTNFPALIGIDQEGGTITRIKDAWYPGAMAAAAAGDAEKVRQMGEYLGQDLRLLGINLNFAPVCDINSNPQNPVIGVRSYGDTPETVAKYSQAFLLGLREGGVLACAKHFPGHGDTATDSHYGLPIIDKSMQELKENELIPFQNAVENQIPAVMTSHILFPQIAQDVPATLSKEILTGLLREEMGFDGLIITDGMRMQAITKYYGLEKACVQAINAGADLLITGSGGGDASELLVQEKAYKAVLAAVINGEISEDRFNQAVLSVLKAKNKAGLLDEKRENIQADWQAHAAFAQQVSRESITIAWDDKKLLPLDGSSVLVISGTSVYQLDEQEQELSGSNSFAAILAEALGGKYRIMRKNMSLSEISGLAKAAAGYDKVVIACTDAGNNAVQKKVIKAVLDANTNVILVSLASPWDGELFSNVPAYVCAYEYTPLSVKSLTDVLTGRAEAVGRLPVTIQKKS